MTIKKVTMQLRNITLEELNSYNKHTLMEQLGIKCIEIGAQHVVATMPVDHRTHQPMGLLHGGASAALIESIGSMGSMLLVELSMQVPVGIEVNANHVAGIKEGFVKGVGKIVHAGKKTHLWQVDIYDGNSSRLIATGRLTVMIIERA
jgi:1,4-dihydroxy-2-naphthoyl-CoA hydrolase